jgi:hypothetical protein
VQLGPHEPELLELEMIRGSEGECVASFCCMKKCGGLMIVSSTS